MDLFFQYIPHHFPSQPWNDLQTLTLNLGVTAYIEVRSNTENRFEGISKQMEMLGAKVSCKCSIKINILWIYHLFIYLYSKSTINPVINLNSSRVIFGQMAGEAGTS